MDAIYGITMEKMAELTAKHGELKAQYGERQGETAFAQYLAEQGLDTNTWAHSWNGWWERFRADPTGRLEARFHQIEGELARKAHFGDVRDMSADTQEGVTLDGYVQIAVAMTQPGANAEAICRQHGLSGVDHWQRVNTAWTHAMSQDAEHKLTMQYGMLYQKYAGPAFQQAQLEQTAAILAEANRPRDVVDEEEVEETPQDLLARLSSKSRNERWAAARRLANVYDLGSDDPDRESYLACVPVLVEILERHDEHTVSDAEDAARKLLEIGQRGDDVRHAMTICLNRGRERLQTFQAAFAPIQNQATPERITLQSRIQDFQSLVESLEGHLGDWEQDE